MSRQLSEQSRINNYNILNSEAKEREATRNKNLANNEFFTKIPSLTNVTSQLPSVNKIKSDSNNELKDRMKTMNNLNRSDYLSNVHIPSRDIGLGNANIGKDDIRGGGQSEDARCSRAPLHQRCQSSDAS